MSPVFNVQPSYGRFMAPATVGMFDEMVPYNVRTLNCEPAGGIAFGLAVGYGTADRGGVLGGAKFVGISVRDVTLPRLEGQSVDVYLQNENMNVLTAGSIWVAVTQTVTKGDPVYYSSTTGAIFNAANTGLVLIPGAEFKTSAVGTGGSPALAEITLGISK